MPADLTNINISDSYKGLIHACGSCLPALANKQVLYDGAGQKSSISIGLEGVGVSVSGPLSISGQLSAGAFLYPASPSTNGYVLAQVNSTTIALTGITDILRSAPQPGSYLPDGTYNNVQNITVKNGLITSVQSTTAVRTFFCDLETFNATALSATTTVTVGAPSRGIYPYGTTNVTAYNVKPLLIRDNYLNKVWGAASYNPMYGTPNIGDVAIVIFSDPVVIYVNYGTAPQMWGIKYVWKGSEWIWERYLAASGPINSTIGAEKYNDGTSWSRTFQVNNQFSSNGNGQAFGVYAKYSNLRAYAASDPVQYT